MVGTGGVSAMTFALPFLSTPAGMGPAGPEAPAAERRVDVSGESKSRETTTSYATPVALAYVIPISVTATSVGMFFATRDADEGVAAGFFLGGALGLVGGVVAPPTVHLFHGNFGTAVASFSGSALSTAGGGFLGLVLTASAWDDEGEGVSVPTAVVGFTAGALLLQGLWGLIDASELAYERREAGDPRRTAARPSASLIAVPWQNGAMLGIRGAF